MDETTVLIYVGLALLGLCAGSFAGASVWRLRARQLETDKSNHEPYDGKEYKRLNMLTRAGILSDRSVCLHCAYQLRWFDLVPLLSWLWLRGRCRKCRHKIGFMEPLIEASTAALFVLSYALWPLPLDNPLAVAQLGLWLLAGVGMAILFVYDLKWFILPNRLTYALIGLGLVSAGISFVGTTDVYGRLADISLSVAILGGLYYVLNKVSSGRWVGFGDVKLGVGLGLLLGQWEQAFIALFAANLIGTLIVLPLMATNKLDRNSHVPLGPLLILGVVFASFAGAAIVDWYLGTLL